MAASRLACHCEPKRSNAPRRRRTTRSTAGCRVVCARQETWLPCRANSSKTHRDGRDRPGASVSDSARFWCAARPKAGVISADDAARLGRGLQSHEWIRIVDTLLAVRARGSVAATDLLGHVLQSIGRFARNALRTARARLCHRPQQKVLSHRSAITASVHGPGFTAAPPVISGRHVAATASS